jgi:hypothetical protein
MAILLAIVGVAFAAFCVWLGVRIVNRRERWAKWTLATDIGLPILYVASFGPACWLCEKGALSPETARAVFRPITWLVVDGPEPASSIIYGYARVCGEQSRTEPVFESVGPAKIAYCGEKRSPGSRSPIDYEVEHSMEGKRIRLKIDIEAGLW